MVTLPSAHAPHVSRHFALVVSFIALTAFSASASAQASVMPSDLVRYAKGMGCKPIDDFYDRPGMVNPPYVYGVLPGEPENSAAFWCEKTKPDEKKYLLLFVAADQTLLRGCPDRIEWWNPPAGLSVERRPLLRLQGYYRAAQPKRPAPMVTIKDATVIVNYYDGLTEEFVCYGGEWLFSMKD